MVSQIEDRAAGQSYVIVRADAWKLAAFRSLYRAGLVVILTSRYVFGT
jgi:hypothetical protein